MQGIFFEYKEYTFENNDKNCTIRKWSERQKSARKCYKIDKLLVEKSKKCAYNTNRKETKPFMVKKHGI